MKYIIIGALLFSMVGCFQNTKNQNKETFNTQKKCNSKSFFLLENEVFREKFLHKVDSLIAIQYPNGKVKTSVDITSDMLVKFLKDIDKNTFLRTNNFEKKYDNLKNTNGIKKYRCSIEFYPMECGYRFVLSSFIETKEWFDETSTIYSFSIINDKIINFARQEAG